jgi:ribosomal-protein-alanine N-acetyltransferase
MGDPEIEQPVLQAMRQEDLDQVLDIERMCFSYPWPRESFLLDLRSPDSCCVVVRMGRELVGYIIGWFVMDELHILNIAIHPSYRRKGMGQRLLRFLLNMAARRGCRYATLELRASNQDARRLYEKHGFRPVAVRRGYYRLPVEDAILMFKDIIPEA